MIKVIVEQTLQRCSGDQGVMDTETLVEKIRDELMYAMSLQAHEIKIELLETEKYGVEWC